MIGKDGLRRLGRNVDPIAVEHAGVSAAKSAIVLPTPDPAVLPLVFLLVGILFFVLTPLLNNAVRMQEKEADMFGLNAARQPDGFAQAAIHLSEYRKMRPGPLEEWLFYDHPSGYDRIHSAMVWKGQNLELFANPPVAKAGQ